MALPLSKILTKLKEGASHHDSTDRFSPPSARSIFEAERLKTASGGAKSNKAIRARIIFIVQLSARIRQTNHPDLYLNGSKQKIIFDGKNFMLKDNLSKFGTMV